MILFELRNKTRLTIALKIGRENRESLYLVPYGVIWHTIRNTISKSKRERLQEIGSTSVNPIAARPDPRWWPRQTRKWCFWKVNTIGAWTSVWLTLEIRPTSQFNRWTNCWRCTAAIPRNAVHCSPLEEITESIVVSQHQNFGQVVEKKKASLSQF